MLRKTLFTSQVSPSFKTMERTADRTILNGGVTLDFSANTENIRDISRTLNYNIFNDATFIYVPSSFAESRNFTQTANIRNIIQWSEDFTQASWTKEQTVVSGNTAIAPDGNLTADKLVVNNNSSPYVRTSISQTTVIGQVYSYSVYVKKADLNYLMIRLSMGGTSRALTVNLNNGVITQGYFDDTLTAPFPDNLTSVIDNNGWINIKFSFNALTTSINVWHHLSNTVNRTQCTGLSGLGTTIWGAQLELGSIVTPYQKTVAVGNGVTDLVFTRATTSTVTNKQGIIEDSCYNLIQQSETLNVTWTPVQSTISANIITAPNGTLTADKIIENTTTNSHFIQQAFNVLNGNNYTVSFYLKAAERFEFSIGFGAAISSSAQFNLNTVTAVGNSAIANITSLPNGWFYCTMTTTTPANSSILINLQMAIGKLGSYNYLGDGVSGIYLWGVQLQLGSVLKPYLRTTNRLNVPRLDYSRGIGEPELLIERASTNLLIQSSSFENSVWNKFNTTVSPNTAIAPDGTMTADALFETTANNSHDVNYYPLSVTSGTTYTYSVYVKANGRTDVAITFESSGFGSSSAYFNLVTESITLTSGVISADIKNVGNGWFRIWITDTATVTIATTSCYIFPILSGTTSSYLGDITKGLYVWGAQVEVGSNATTYIPTTTATVTRNAETSYVDLFNNAALNKDNFTLFIEGYNISNGTTSINFGISDNTGTGGNYLGFYNGITPAISSPGFSTGGVPLNTNTNYKFVIQRSGTSVKFFRNGAQIWTTQTVAVLDYRYIIIIAGSSTFTIDKIALFNRSLSDTECISLTL